MLQTYPGADGLKTGWIAASGHNLVTSAVRGGVRLVGVVLGAGSSGERDLEMTDLLDRGFERVGIPSALYANREPMYRVPQLMASAQAAPVLEPRGLEPRYPAAPSLRPIRAQVPHLVIPQAAMEPPPVRDMGRRGSRRHGKVAQSRSAEPRSGKARKADRRTAGGRGAETRPVAAALERDRARSVAAKITRVRSATPAPRAASRKAPHGSEPARPARTRPAPRIRG